MWQMTNKTSEVDSCYVIGTPSALVLALHRQPAGDLEATAATLAADSRFVL